MKTREQRIVERRQELRSLSHFEIDQLIKRHKLEEHAEIRKWRKSSALYFAKIKLIAEHEVDRE